MSALHASAARSHATPKAAPPVMRRAAPPSRHAAPPIASLAAIPAGPLVQRECADCEREEEGKSEIQRRLKAAAAAPSIQRKCTACEQEDRDESPVQPRLEVGPVGDRYEQEADSIAAQVMAMRDPGAGAGDAAAGASAAGGAVQRACSACASASDDEPRARRFAEPEAETDQVVRARRDDGAETIAASDAQLTSGGSALPAATRGFFESRMGRDLGDVRVHQGGAAATMNDSISARAFTYKNHVWLGSGETAAPSFTMAHELAHVMQQTSPGPVGPQRREASEAEATVQRSAPFFMQSGKKAPNHAKMHEVAQKSVRKHNTNLLTEVPIPGANRKKVALGKCGFADFYTATAVGSLIPVPGVESVEGAAGSGTTKLQNFTETTSKSSCVGTVAFGTAMRGDAAYALGPARGPKLDAAGKVDLAGAPSAIKVGELKPAHDINYRGSGVTQLENYISGINAAATETNSALTAETRTESWQPSPTKWTDITLPPGWDATGTDAGTKWPVPDLMVRDYQKAPALPPAAKKQKKAKGAPAATAKDVQSGSNVKISGRWMLAKDSTRISGGDGVYVYFLAPNPDELTRALKSRKTSAEFRKLSKKVREVYKPLLATPDVKKARKQALPGAPLNGQAHGASPAGVVRAQPAQPKVQRKATDPFNRKQWELLRTGAFEGETRKGSLAELFATTPSEQLRDETAQLNGIAEWVRSPPETPKGVTYSKDGANENDPASEDFDTLRRAAFWSGPLASPIGLLRERFGQMFIRGHAAFVKVKKKIRAVFKNAKFSAGSSSGIGAAAAKVVGKVFMQLGKVVLARTADIIAECMKSGFAAFMKKQVEGHIDELLVKAEEAKVTAEQIKEDVEEKIKSALESVIGGYEAKIKEIADDAKVIAAIAGAVSEVVRIARLAFCASGLAAAGWGAIVTCLLSIADWIASKFDASPLDGIIKRVMNSCRGRKLFAEAMMSFETVRTLPTLLAKTILRPLKANLPSPADEMLCNIDDLKVPDLSMADFECKSGDGDGDGDGGGGGDGDEEGEEEGESGDAGSQTGDSEGGGNTGGDQAGTSEGKDSGTANAGGGEAKGGQGGQSKPQGTSSVSGGAVTKGDPDVGNGFIDSGLDPNGTYKNTRATVRVTINLGEHVIRDQPCTIVVVDLVAAEGGGKYAQFYFPDDPELIKKEGTFEIKYSDDPTKNYKWSPKRGPKNAARFFIRGSAK